MSITAYPFPHLTTVFDSCFTYGVNSPSSGSSSRRLPFSQRIKQRKKVRKINVFPLAECRLGAKKRWALSISGFLLTLFRRRRLLPCPPLKMRRHLFIPFQPLHYRQQTQKTSLGCETWQSEGRRREPPERKKKDFFFLGGAHTFFFRNFSVKKKKGPSSFSNSGHLFSRVFSF